VRRPIRAPSHGRQCASEPAYDRLPLDDGVENPEQFLVPRAAPDLHMADAALRAERPKARQLVATLAGRGYGEAAEHVH